MSQLDLGLAPEAQPAKRWNPRYALYAKANGREPEAMLEHDREAYPGGCMTGFILWIPRRWAEWRELRGYRWDAPLTNADHVDFDVWLAERVKAGGVA